MGLSDVQHWLKDSDTGHRIFLKCDTISDKRPPTETVLKSPPPPPPSPEPLVGSGFFFLGGGGGCLLEWEGDMGVEVSLCTGRMLTKACGTLVWSTCISIAVHSTVPHHHTSLFFLILFF